MSKYIDNKKFLAALRDYDRILHAPRPDGSPPPRIPEYIGSCFLLIAENVSMKSNFYGYSYREEMVSDAVLNCIKYVSSFDVSKENPFAYFTTVCVNSCINRINIEEKKQYLKYKSFVNDLTDPNMYIDTNGDNIIHGDIYENINQYVEDYEEKIRKRRDR